jgi:hypothetical protein
MCYFLRLELSSKLDYLTSVLIADDTAEVTTAPTTGLQCSEAGGTSVLSLVLTSEPVAPVTIGVTLSDSSEGNLGLITSITFGPATWSTVQSVTVTCVGDDVVGGHSTFIVTATATSGDTNYNGLVDDANVGNAMDGECFYSHPRVVFATDNTVFSRTHRRQRWCSRRTFERHVCE